MENTTTTLANKVENQTVTTAKSDNETTTTTTTTKPEATTSSNLQHNVSAAAATTTITTNVSSTFETTTVNDDDNNGTSSLVLPVGDARRCPGKLKVLPALPGSGWDNLRAETTASPIVRFNYSLCRTTSDGRFLIPDGTDSVAKFTLSADPVADVFPSYLDYYPVATRGLVGQPSDPKYLTVSGSFSDAYERVKRAKIVDGAVTVRVQITSELYELSFNGERMNLTSGFEESLLRIANLVANADAPHPSANATGNHTSNHTTTTHHHHHHRRDTDDLIDYYADELVRDYGTHVVTGVTAGGMIVTEDEVRAQAFADVDEALDRAELRVAAKTVFERRFNLTTPTTDDQQKLDQLVEKYKTATIDSATTINGGDITANGTTTTTLNEWKFGVASFPVTTERNGGQFLDEFIGARQQFLPVPPSIVDKLRMRVRQAIDRYYARNTHSGCTDPTSPNFVPTANVDDSNCLPPPTNFTFGGFYQTCGQDVDAESVGDFCKDLKQKNPLTNDYTCPDGYEATPLHFKMTDKWARESDNDDCKEVCDDWLDCHTVCKPRYALVTVEYKSYWCAATAQDLPVSANSGYLFGGIYTSRSVNTNTGSSGCPVGFRALKMLDDVHVCVSDDYERDAGNAVAFGGFFDCSAVGNPLAAANANDTDYPRSCPTGYSKHVAAIYGDCEVNYCTAHRFSANATTTPTTTLPLVRPPYSERPRPTTTGARSVVFVDGSSSEIWYRTRNATGGWTRATKKEELREAGLEGLWSLIEPDNTTVVTTDRPDGNTTLNNTAQHDKKDDDGGLGGGAIAAIAICATLAVIAVLGTVAYLVARKRAGRGRSGSKAPLEEETGEDESPPHQNETHHDEESPDETHQNAEEHHQQQPAESPA